MNDLNSSDMDRSDTSSYDGYECLKAIL